jgi:hypothetical protein
LPSDATCYKPSYNTSTKGAAEALVKEVALKKLSYDDIFKTIGAGDFLCVLQYRIISELVRTKRVDEAITIYENRAGSGYVWTSYDRCFAIFSLHKAGIKVGRELEFAIEETQPHNLQSALECRFISREDIDAMNVLRKECNP